MGVDRKSLERSNAGATKAAEANVTDVSDRDNSDNDQLARLGKKSVLRVRKKVLLFCQLGELTLFSSEILASWPF